MIDDLGETLSLSLHGRRIEQNLADEKLSRPNINKSGRILRQ